MEISFEEKTIQKECQKIKINLQEKFIKNHLPIFFNSMKKFIMMKYLLKILS